MVINHAGQRNAVWSMERLNIAMSANNIHAKSINTLTNMTLLSRTGGERQIQKERRAQALSNIILNSRKKYKFFPTSNYNDGRRKNFFCVAVNLLELSELQEAMKQIQSNDELPLLSFKEQCSYVAEVFQKIADRRNIKLRLIKKK